MRQPCHCLRDDCNVQVDLIVKKDATSVIPGHQLDYSIDVGMKGSDLWNDIWPDLIRMTPNTLTGKVSLGVDPKTGKEFLQKQLSPEALEVQKARKAAQKQIDDLVIKLNNAGKK